MRWFLGRSLVNAYSRCGLLAVMLAVSPTHSSNDALGQSQPPIQFPPAAGQNNPRPPFGAEPDASQDPMYRHAQQEAAKKRNIDRQNKLVADSARIARLANELNTGVALSGKDATSAAMAKKAEEVEKLARSVRDLMKSE